MNGPLLKLIAMVHIFTTAARKLKYSLIIVFEEPLLKEELDQFLSSKKTYILRENSASVPS